MKMKELERLYNQAKMANDVNDVLIDSSMREIEECDDKETRSKEVEMLKKELETKDKLNEVAHDFEKRKAWREGYIVATVSAVIGIIIGEYVSPIVINMLKKN